jgi:methylated-DNA-[protein]-cysteine S-methyltransferase
MRSTQQDGDQTERIQRITSIGRLILCANKGAIVSIGMSAEGEPEYPEICAAEHILNCAAQELTEYFAGERHAFTFAMRPFGTSFQKRVWDALLNIPYGETKSYGQIAKETANPRAARAVGMACNRNPIMIAVPCHRVVGADGSMTGYALGTDLKRTLLSLEQTAK